MRQFVESIYRLYKNGMVNEERLLDLFDKGKITESEKDYILNNAR